MHRFFTRRALHALIPSGSAFALGICFHPYTAAQLAPPPPPGNAAPVAIEASPLTLQQALARSMASNAELAVATREVEAAQGPVLQGAARPNPALSVLLEDTRRSTRTSTLQINQPFELGGQRAARISAAERGRDIAAAELASKRADIHATVAGAFHEVWLAQERLRLNRQSVELARRTSDAAGKRVQAGKVSPVEETKARIAEANARLDVAQAEAELVWWRLQLAGTWGGASSIGAASLSVAAVEEGNALPTPELIAQRIDASPALARARLEVQRRGAISELARAQRTPDVTLSLGVKRDAELGLTQAVIGVSMPLPVFDRNEGNLLEALRREDKSRDELLATDIALRTSAQQSVGRLAAANAEVQMIREQVLPGAQSAHEAATKGFELGKFNLLDVLDAQRTLFQAQSQHLRARGDALRAAVELDRLLGGSESAVAMPAPSAPNQIQE